MSVFILTHSRYGICVSDHPRPLFEFGHAADAYRACLPVLEAGYGDVVMFDDLFTDAVFGDAKKPNRLTGGRLYHHQAVHGNGKGRRRRSHRPATMTNEQAPALRQQAGAKPPGRVIPR